MTNIEKINEKRAFYIPKNSTKFTCKETGATLHAYENAHGQPALMAFAPKAIKPTMHYRFSDSTKRDKRASDFLANQRRRAAERKERRAKRNAPHNLEVGTILVSSWGYDQTNVEFWKVKNIVGKTMVEIVEISCVTCNDGGATGWASDKATAGDSEIGELKRCKVDMSYGSASVRVHSCATASVWDGKARHRSWYA